MMEPVETDGGLQVEGEEQTTGESAVVASLKQLFTGLRVGQPTLKLQCRRCGTHLCEGDTVSVYAYRTVDTPHWHLARCRCSVCATEDIKTPTLGATEVRLTARAATVSDMGTQQHRLCLAAPAITAVSSPQDGTPP